VPEATLVELITRQADEEARRIGESAAAEAAALRGEAVTREAAQIRARVVARGRELETQHGRAIAAARRAARIALLAAREHLVDRVMEAARDQLPGVDLPTDVLTRLVDAGSSYLPPGGMILRCPTRLLALMRATMAARVAVECLADDDIRAGVRLESADGRVVVDNTLDTRLGHRRRVLAIELLARVAPP